MNADDVRAKYRDRVWRRYGMMLFEAEVACDLLDDCKASGLRLRGVEAFKAHPNDCIQPAMEFSNISFGRVEEVNGEPKLVEFGRTLADGWAERVELVEETKELIRRGAAAGYTWYEVSVEDPSNGKLLFFTLTESERRDLWERLRKDLPCFPVDVIREWLLKFAVEDGWPPAIPRSSRWTGVLQGRPLAYWQSLQWRKETIAMRPGSFSTTSWTRFQEIAGACVAGTNNRYSRIMDSKKRFERLCSVVRDKRSLPSPPVAVRDQLVLEVFDGSQRLAAYWWLLKELRLADPVLWVGSRIVDG